MSRSAYPSVFRRPAAKLLLFGLLVVTLHALAGTRLMRIGATPGNYAQPIAEVCTGHGVTSLIPHRRAVAGSPALAVHYCCKPCAASGLSLAATHIGVTPAPTLAALQNSSAAERLALVAAPTSPSRGPPTRA